MTVRRIVPRFRGEISTEVRDPYVTLLGFRVAIGSRAGTATDT